MHVYFIYVYHTLEKNILPFYPQQSANSLRLKTNEWDARASSGTDFSTFLMRYSGEVGPGSCLIKSTWPGEKAELIL